MEVVVEVVTDFWGIEAPMLTTGNGKPVLNVIAAPVPATTAPLEPEDVINSEDNGRP